MHELQAELLAQGHAEADIVALELDGEEGGQRAVRGILRVELAFLVGGLDGCEAVGCGDLGDAVVLFAVDEVGDVDEQVGQAMLADVYTRCSASC